MTREIDVNVAIFKDLGFSDYELLLDAHLYGLPYLPIKDGSTIHSQVDNFISFLLKQPTLSQYHGKFHSFYETSNSIKFYFTLVADRSVSVHRDYIWHNIRELPTIYPDTNKDKSKLHFVESAFHSIIRKHYI